MDAPYHPVVKEPPYELFSDGVAVFNVGYFRLSKGPGIGYGATVIQNGLHVV
jgi:hypothetical protein